MKLNLKSQNSKRKTKNGFTLVELLASIIVLVAVGSVIAGIISSTLRGTNKANNIENIRQSGNYTLNQMSKDIAYSQPFDGANTGLFNTVDDSGNNVYMTSCPSGDPQGVTVKSVSNVMTTYNCNGSVFTANGIPLIDTSISVQNCKLTCVRIKATDVPIVGISFTLTPKNVNGLAEQSNSIDFKTSVTLRNYNK